MAVPDGIVERKGVRAACAPPWGTNYEMKAKKNSKKLTYFHDEGEGDSKNDASGPKGSIDGLASQSETRLTGDGVEGALKKSGSCPIHGGVSDKLTDETQKAHIQTDDSSGEKINSGDTIGRDATEAPEKGAAEAPDKAAAGPRAQWLPKGSKSYVTSNSAYGHHQTDDAINPTRSYRRVCTFSKLYGDTQLWKK